MTEITAAPQDEQTEVGSYFVANYPPFSVWTPEAVATDARAALGQPRVPGTPPACACAVEGRTLRARQRNGREILRRRPMAPG